MFDRSTRSVYQCLVSRWQNIEGRGAVCFDDDGSVKLFVSDEVAEFVTAAESQGISADDLVNRIIDEAEADAAEMHHLADGTGPIVRPVPPVWAPDYS